jgi:hypothetical protein
MYLCGSDGLLAVATMVALVAAATAVVVMTTDDGSK